MSTIEARLQAALEKAVNDTNNPGAVACVGNRETNVLLSAYGLRQTTPEQKPAEVDTLYDLASLTKVAAATTAFLLLWEDGLVDPDFPVTEIIPIEAYERLTFRHLLTHSGGLVSFRPYYRDASDMTEMLAMFAELGINGPPGVRRTYSDVGFMLLGHAVELAAQDTLDNFCRERIYEPLGMDRTGFNPSEELAATAAATEDCGWRGRIMAGEVHDENAYAVGGVSGHAGLFSTAGDMARYCRGMLNGQILREETIREMIRPGQLPFHPWQGLGWQINPWSDTAQGFLPSRTAFGHSGFTGTSLWLDWDSGNFAILLGNTCHTSRGNSRNRQFRQTFHQAVARNLYLRNSATHVGLDRVLRNGFSPLKQGPFALLTNHGAVDHMNRHILDLIAFDPSLELTRLFSPEHGIRGHAEAGEHVGSEEWRGVPVVSLYGQRREPTLEELRDIDLFVVDLPDIGSRYYTYIATMKNCMAVCAEAGVPVLVLDRPNPVGGAILEGPIAEDTRSLVSCAAIPIRHGMTMGEVALYFRDHELDNAPEVSVLSLDNWHRDLYYEELSLPWVTPSPNIPEPDTTLLYVGTCLFEGVNINEGRGTRTPFHIIGAPWLDPDAVLAELTPGETVGCRLAPADYTPQSIPGMATNPEYLDQPCKGIWFEVEDKRLFRPLTTTLAIIQAIRRRHPDEFEWKPMFNTLAGGPRLRRLMEDGATALDLAAAFEPELEAFREKMPRRYELL